MSTLEKSKAASRSRRNYRWVDMLLIVNGLSALIAASVGGGYIHVGPEGSSVLVLPLMASAITMWTLIRYVDVDTVRDKVRHKG